jgi:hypothetical protein
VCPRYEASLEELAADPHPLLARLRERAPVCWVPALGGWLVTGYVAAVEVLSDPATFTVDDPRFAGAGVTPATVLSWYRDIVAAVAALPASAAGSPTTVRVGSFDALADRLREAITAGGAPVLADAAGSGELTADEVISNAAVELFGGIETTEGMICNAVLHLLSDPAQLGLVRADWPGPTATRRSSPNRTVTTSGGRTRPGTWPSPAARISAWARTWPGWRRRPRSARCSTGCRDWPWIPPSRPRRPA